LKLVTVRKKENDGWIVNDRSARANRKIPHFTTKAEAVKVAKGVARDKHSIFAVIDNNNEPIEVVNYSNGGNFVKDRSRRNNILRAVVKTAINQY